MITKVFVLITVGLFISLFMFMIFGINLSAFLPTGCNKNYVCENEYTKIAFGYNDRKEGFFPFRCYKTDCCYDKEYSKETCRRYLKAMGEEDLSVCDNPDPKDPKFLFSCAESWELCDNETCIQSCNHNGICEPGEWVLCDDCT